MTSLSEDTEDVEEEEEAPEWEPHAHLMKAADDDVDDFIAASDDADEDEEEEEPDDGSAVSVSREDSSESVNPSAAPRAGAAEGQSSLEDGSSTQAEQAEDDLASVSVNL